MEALNIIILSIFVLFTSLANAKVREHEFVVSYFSLLVFYFILFFNELKRQGLIAETYM
jgi:hypothetical protein